MPYSLLKFMTKDKKINKFKGNGKNILETGYSILKSMAKGIDKKAVTLALQNKYNNDFNKADEYLEKIFDKEEE